MIVDPGLLVDEAINQPKEEACVLGSILIGSYLNQSAAWRCVCNYVLITGYHSSMISELRAPHTRERILALLLSGTKTYRTREAQRMHANSYLERSMPGRREGFKQLPLVVLARNTKLKQRLGYSSQLR